MFDLKSGSDLYYYYPILHCFRFPILDMGASDYINAKMDFVSKVEIRLDVISEIGPEKPLFVNWCIALSQDTSKVEK